ncbi:MAG: hypothetical protein ACI8QC_001947 [Planctomycetota bacterium]|jgi:hypothetical protein
MTDLSSNTRRDELPRFVVYSSGTGWVVADRLIPGTGVGDKPAEYEHGKRGVRMGLYPNREMAIVEARLLG